MNWLANFWSRIVEATSEREAATTFACIRICVGLVMLYILWSAFYAGYVDTLWVDSNHDPAGFAPYRGNWLIHWLGGGTKPLIVGLFSIAAIGSVFLTLGAFARPAAFVVLICFSSLVSTHPDTSGGADILTTNALWLLVLARSDVTLSVRARWKTGSWRSNQLVPSWPRALFIFQLVIVYFSAGINKGGSEWMPGGGYAALHYILQDPTWIRFHTDTFFSLSPLTRIGTAVTWHWEQITPILLLYIYCYRTRERGGRVRRWVTRFDLRIAWAAIGVFLHIGIAVTLNVGAFSFIALTYYLSLFRPSEIEGAGRWLVNRFDRNQPVRAGSTDETT